MGKSKELEQVMSQYPNYDFPVLIPEHNSGAYCFIGVRAKNDGLSQKLQIHQFCKSTSDWMALKDEFKSPKYLGNYHTVIMIHNPTFKPAPIEEVKKKKRVTPPVKKKIEAMAADGASADVIAEDLGLELEQVEKYL